MSENNLPATVSDVEVNNDESVVNFVVGQRLKIHQQIVNAAGPEGILPMDSDLGSFMNENLKELGKTALSRAKVRNEAQANKTNEALAQAVVESILNQTRPTNNTYFDHEGDPNRTAPQLPDEIDAEPLALPEGATHIGVTHETIDEFLSRTAHVQVDTSAPSDD